MNRNIYKCTLKNRDNTNNMDVIITDRIYSKYRDFIVNVTGIANSYKLTPLKDILIFMGDNT